MGIADPNRHQVPWNRTMLNLKLSQFKINGEVNTFLSGI